MRINRIGPTTDSPQVERPVPNGGVLTLLRVGRQTSDALRSPTVTNGGVGFPAVLCRWYYGKRR